jgi:hypothetical protein
VLTRNVGTWQCLDVQYHRPLLAALCPPLPGSLDPRTASVAQLLDVLFETDAVTPVPLAFPIFLGVLHNLP